jgi:uncharacterized protein YjbI with pentapeptide repeats
MGSQCAFRAARRRSRHLASTISTVATRLPLLDHWDNREMVRRKPRMTVEPPDLPELERRQLDGALMGGDLTLDGLLLEAGGSKPVHADRIRVAESELRGLTIDTSGAPGLQLSDVILRDCNLSNIDGREGSLRRVEIHGSMLVGFGLSGGTVQDLSVIDSSLALASLAFSTLRNALFERVDLSEASFIQARLESVSFIDCKLAGADFRGARLKGCAIRGTPLDGIVGIDCLNGVLMPWPDVLASAPALATALGIVIEPD